jgi:hypothetical protein
MPGNSLGVRKWYEYEGDSGVKYSYLTDVDLSVAAGAVENAGYPNFPKRFKPRVVFVEGTSATGQKLRKALIVPVPDSSLYTPQISQVINIDTLAFQTTGRRGEQASFASN